MHYARQAQNTDAERRACEIRLRAADPTLPYQRCRFMAHLHHDVTWLSPLTRPKRSSAGQDESEVGLAHKNNIGTGPTTRSQCVSFVLVEGKGTPTPPGIRIIGRSRSEPTVVAAAGSIYCLDLPMSHGAAASLGRRTFMVAVPICSAFRLRLE
jgi:hypothetical protein